MIAKVSVIVPVYNVAPYLRQCLDSLVGQTLRDIEIICVDDGSTDGSSALLEDYAAKDPRVRIVRQPNGGPGSARNRGLAVADGEFVYFLDSDDWLEPEALAFLYEECSSQNLDMLVFSAEPFADAGCVGVGASLEKSRRRYTIPGALRGKVVFGSEFLSRACQCGYFASVPLRLIRRSILTESRLVFAEGIVHEDELFTPQALCLCKRVQAVDRRLYKRRIRAESITTSSFPQAENRRLACRMAVHAELLALARRNRTDQEIQRALRISAWRLLGPAVSASRRPGCSLVAGCWQAKKLVPMAQWGALVWFAMRMWVAASRAMPFFHRLECKEKNRMPAVSVVVPVYNVAKYLRQCLDSLVTQTLRDIDIICVDDGSTDGSGAILDEYAAKDSRVKVIHQANAGAGPARNAGMAEATGEYLFFCDPDDWCGRRLLAGMYRRARSVRADILLAPTYRCDSVTNRVIGVRRPQKRFRGVFSGTAAEGSLFSISYHTVWDKLFRREFVVSEGLAFQPVRRFNDMLFCDLALALADRIAEIRTPGYYHRVARNDGLHAGAGRTPELVLDVYDALRGELERRGVFERYCADYAAALFNHGCGLTLECSNAAVRASFYEKWLGRLYGLEINAHNQLGPLGRGMAAVFSKDMSCEDFAFALAGVANGLRFEANRPSFAKGLKMVCRSVLPYWLEARR